MKIFSLNYVVLKYIVFAIIWLNFETSQGKYVRTGSKKGLIHSKHIKSKNDGSSCKTTTASSTAAECTTASSSCTTTKSTTAFSCSTTAKCTTAQPACKTTKSTTTTLSDTTPEDTTTSPSETSSKRTTTKCDSTDGTKKDSVKGCSSTTAAKQTTTPCAPTNKCNKTPSVCSTTYKCDKTSSCQAKGEMNSDNYIQGKYLRTGPRKGLLRSKNVKSQDTLNIDTIGTEQVVMNHIQCSLKNDCNAKKDARKRRELKSLGQHLKAAGNDNLKLKRKGFWKLLNKPVREKCISNRHASTSKLNVTSLLKKVYSEQKARSFSKNHQTEVDRSNNNVKNARRSNVNRNIVTRKYNSLRQNLLLRSGFKKRLDPVINLNNKMRRSLIDDSNHISNNSSVINSRVDESQYYSKILFPCKTESTKCYSTCEPSSTVVCLLVDEVTNEDDQELRSQRRNYRAAIYRRKRKRDDGSKADRSPRSTTVTQITPIAENLSNANDSLFFAIENRTPLYVEQIYLITNKVASSHR